MDWFVNVRPTILTTPAFLETYASAKLPFTETGTVRSFAEFPAMEEYELLGEYRGLDSCYYFKD